MGIMDDILVAGCGRLAHDLINGLEALPFTVDKAKARAVIYAGSGRELEAVTTYCHEKGAILIQASTGIEHPSSPSIPYIIAPNLSLAVLKFIDAIKDFTDHFKGAQITLTESHQKTKQSAPGTAERLKDSLGLDSYSSIRQEESQKEYFQVPPKHLDRHAIHEVKINLGSAEVRAQVRIMGKEPYIEGAKALLKLDLSRLKPGLYLLEDLMSCSSSPLLKSDSMISQPPMNSPQM
jgi:dihydrodipicolinate reductase